MISLAIIDKSLPVALALSVNALNSEGVTRNRIISVLASPAGSFGLPALD